MKLIQIFRVSIKNRPFSAPRNLMIVLELFHLKMEVFVSEPCNVIMVILNCFFSTWINIHWHLTYWYFSFNSILQFHEPSCSCKHVTLTRCWFNVGLTWRTLDQISTNTTLIRFLLWIPLNINGNHSGVIQVLTTWPWKIAAFFIL